MKKDFSYKTPKQKNDERVTVIKTEMKEQKVKALKEVKIKTGKYRYFCDACTNIAFWSNVIGSGSTRICPTCGKVFVTKEKNYILD